MRDINRLREMVRFELNKEIKKGVSRLVTNVRQRKNSELEFYSKFFLCPTLVTRRITSFSISLPSSKLTISYSIYKHDAEHDDIHDADAIDIVDLSSMQDAYRMNFVIHLAHRRVSVVEHLEHQRSEV